MEENTSNKPVEQNAENVQNSVKQETTINNTTSSESIAEKVLRQIQEKKKVTTGSETTNVSASTTEPTVKKEEKTEEKVIAVPQSTTTTEIHSELDLVSQIADAEIEEDEDDDEVDYFTLSKEELVSSLAKLLDNKSVLKIKSSVDTIKTVFYRRHNAEIKEKRNAFVEEGGNPEEFKPEVDAIEESFKELLKKYREDKADLNDRMEKEKDDNLQKKKHIIEQIKNLLHANDDSFNDTFNQFRELQKQWREVGNVPQTEMKNLWETYNHYTEQFYNFIKINKELRDLDLKRNLENKILLCEKAEELLLEPSIINAFKNLQKYHAEWREIGPVPVEKKDEIWERFKEATTSINKKHQDYFEEIRDEQQNNLNAKTLLCEKAEELATLNIATHKDWDDKSKELIELQKIWKLIGYAPKKDNNKIYTRFRSACDDFFDRKREYYNSFKEEQNNNFQQKTELCIQAEALKDNTDWKTTTEEFINLQNEWKKIGPVPRKHSDALWKRFRTACNFFFDKKKEYFESIDSVQDENLRRKNELIEKIENFVFEEDYDLNLTALKDFQKEWTEIGHVPFKHKDEIQKRYRKAINSRFEQFKFDENKRTEIKFKNRLETIKQSNKSGTKIRAEKEKIAAKMVQVQSDIALWENNIGFFAKSKNAEALINDVKNKIEKAKQHLKSLKEQLELVENVKEEN